MPDIFKKFMGCTFGEFFQSDSLSEIAEYFVGRPDGKNVIYYRAKYGQWWEIH